MNNISTYLLLLKSYSESHGTFMDLMNKLHLNKQKMHS